MKFATIFTTVVICTTFHKCLGKSKPKPSCHYPPSQWCRSLEIAIECKKKDHALEIKTPEVLHFLQPCEENSFLVGGEGKLVQKQCMELSATKPNPAVPPVEVTLYYESLCPGCRTFMSHQLYPTWTLLQDIMEVKLVPYGNTEEIPTENAPFTCQHGEPECEINMIQSCIQHLAGHLAFPVIYCMESSADVSEAAQSCLQLYAPSLTWNDITSCVKGELGHKLMYENALTTRALNPAHTHVPWVTFDGEYTVEFQDKAMSSLFSLVCDLYKGGKPPACTGALKKIDRSFC